MKITIAKDAGYCFGVRDAVNIAYDTSKVQGDVYMLGDIVHNEKVVADLSKVGTKVVESIDDIPNDKPVLFRAHLTASASGQDGVKEKCHALRLTQGVVVSGEWVFALQNLLS